MFVGRTEELNLLQAGMATNRSEFLVLYGRRRIGKSTLLEQFVKGYPCFFFTAGRESKGLLLQRFARELGDACGDSLVLKMKLTEWEDALTLLDQKLGSLMTGKTRQKVIVVFDEFQWMCSGSPELLSDLQRFWDKKWKDQGNLYLILCGSSISFMLGDVLSRKSPLFGRRTRSFRLEPFKLEESARLLPRWGRFEVAESYFAVGGVPKYLEVLGAHPSLRTALAQECFSPGGYFVDELRFVLSEQLRETEHYFQVLQPLASRAMSVSELHVATTISTGQLMFYLERLQLLGFVRREIPVGANPGTRRVRYRLDDHFLRFYFSFIHPVRTRIAHDAAGSDIAQVTLARWDAFAGRAFKEVTLSHAASLLKKLGFADTVTSAGSYWQKPTKKNPGIQIDVLIDCGPATSILCECKWSRKPVGMEVVTELRRKAELLPGAEGKTVHLLLVSAAGVTKAVKDADDVLVLSLKDFWS